MHSPFASQASARRPAVSRRAFLTASAAALAAGALSRSASAMAGEGPAGAKPLVGSQLYGWGQYYQREGKNLNDHLDDVLSALRDAGYDYAEGFVDAGNPEGNLKFATQLRGKGLRPVALYTGGRLHDEKADEVVARLLVACQACREAGFQVINCNPDPIGRAKTDAELERQATALTRFGTRLQGMGLKLGIHHHTPELANEAREFHYNFRHSPKEIVGFNIDTHWMYRGGLAPMAALREYGDRVVSWHLRQSRDKVWWEDLDAGDVDYAEIASFAKASGIAPIYSVELALEDGTKITRSAVENHRRSREFVRRVFGA
jgi:sugar phosphate isomerase/epimerase